MIIARDLYTFVVYSDITASEKLGTTIIQYEVREYTDVRNLTEAKAYIVTCNQRLILPNPTQYTPAAANVSSFNSYPALLGNSIAVSFPNQGIKQMVLLEYFPKTLNTAVVSSQVSGDSSNISISQQYTSGSTIAQTNSYGVSPSFGFMGGLTGDTALNFQKSTTREDSFALSNGNALDKGTQLSNSNAMTIKDWGSYASVDVSDDTPTWVWGQEYPWNVVQLKNIDSSGNIVLPAAVQQRLYDGTQVYPPSELSLFGVDFICKASWLITPDAGQAQPEISFVHTLSYTTGSHGLDDQNNFSATLDNSPAITYTSPSLDLAVLALDPISTTGGGGGIIGFVPNQFDVVPASGSPFSITSESTDLLVRGSGFTGIMSTDLSVASTAQMNVYFKLVNSTDNVALSLKHWVTNSSACQLTIVVNGDATITKFVDAPETGSGGDNVMVIALRNKDFTSVDYCDYLQMGLNTLEITISPVGSGGGSYQLLAMAVG